MFLFSTTQHTLISAKDCTKLDTCVTVHYCEWQSRKNNRGHSFSDISIFQKLAKGVDLCPDDTSLYEAVLLNLTEEMHKMEMFLINYKYCKWLNGKRVQNIIYVFFVKPKVKVIILDIGLPFHFFVKLLNLIKSQTPILSHAIIC